MLEFWQSLVITGSLLSLVIVLIGFVIIPCCRHKGDNENIEQHSTSWGRLAVPYNHESHSASVPSMPPYFFINELSYDSYSASV